MSQQEAPGIDMFDAPEKPIDLSKFTGGEPDGQPSSSMLAAFGLPTDTPPPDQGTAPEKPKDTPEEVIDDPNAKKLVDKYSAKIQETAEELYANMLYRAKTEDGYLAKLAQSQDKTEQKLVKKILERNPEFGASTPEEYRLLTEKQQAKDDPEAQERIDLKHRLNTQDQKLKELEWDKLKERNGIDGDFGQQVDDLHSQHPDLPFGKIVAMAKGLSGGSATPQTKREASFASGGANPTQTEDVFSSPLAKRLLKDAGKTKQFAKEYFGSF